MRDDQVFHAAELKLGNGEAIRPEHITLVRCMDKSGRTVQVLLGLDLCTYEKSLGSQQPLQEAGVKLWIYELSKRVSAANVEKTGESKLVPVQIYSACGAVIIGPVFSQLRQLRQVGEAQSTLALPSREQADRYCYAKSGLTTISKDGIHNDVGKIKLP